MKQIKHLVLRLARAALIVTGLISCSNEEINLQRENSEQSIMQSKSVARSFESGYEYAKNFYQLEIELGNSVELIDPETNEGVVISEVLVYGTDRARGYIVNKLESNEFLYFADVDREHDVLTTYNAIEDGQEIFENLLSSENYLATDKFDFIKYASEYANTTYGSDCGFLKRLWGTCVRKMPISDLGGGQCGRQVNVVKYRFFQPIDNSGSYYQTGPCAEM